eukprot:scaffold2532_cov243-Pinguiococcus_pyrenoidosus.AAC.7
MRCVLEVTCMLKVYVGVVELKCGVGEAEEKQRRKPHGVERQSCHLRHPRESRSVWAHASQEDMMLPQLLPDPLQNAFLLVGAQLLGAQQAETVPKPLVSGADHRLEERLEAASPAILAIQSVQPRSQRRRHQHDEEETPGNGRDEKDAQPDAAVVVAGVSVIVINESNENGSLKCYNWLPSKVFQGHRGDDVRPQGGGGGEVRRRYGRVGATPLSGAIAGALVLAATLDCGAPDHRIACGSGCEAFCCVVPTYTGESRRRTGDEHGRLHAVTPEAVLTAGGQRFFAEGAGFNNDSGDGARAETT